MKISSGQQQAYAAMVKTAQAQDPSRSSGKSQQNQSHGIQLDSVSLSSEFGSADWMQKVLMTEVGRKVENMLGEAGISVDAIMAQNDWSPEAVSDRIVGFTTGFWEMFRSQNEDMSDEEAATAFEKLVTGAVNDGARQAMSMLAAHEAGGEARSVAEQTMGLVHEKLGNFFSELRASFNAVEEG